MSADQIPTFSNATIPVTALNKAPSDLRRSRGPFTIETHERLSGSIYILEHGEAVARLLDQEIAELFAAAPEMAQALSRIAEGQVFKPTEIYSMTDVVIAYQQIARGALPKANAAAGYVARISEMPNDKTENVHV